MNCDVSYGWLGKDVKATAGNWTVMISKFEMGRIYGSKMWSETLMMFLLETLRRWKLALAGFMKTMC